MQLSDADRAMLGGDKGPAPQLAMSILVRMAAVYGADALMDISQAHIDSTIYLGDATLEFAADGRSASRLVCGLWQVADLEMRN